MTLTKQVHGLKVSDRRGLAWFRQLGKRTSVKLATCLVVAYAEDNDQKARELLYSFWPEADWDGFIRDNLGSGPLAIYDPRLVCHLPSAIGHSAPEAA